MKAREIERISKALGDPHRIRILEEVKKKEWMQYSDICELIELTQPCISHHIKQLTDAELLIPEKEGRNMKYAINKDVLGAYIGYLKKLE